MLLTFDRDRLVWVGQCIVNICLDRHEHCNFSLDGGDKSKRTDVRVVSWCTGLGLPGKEWCLQSSWMVILFVGAKIAVQRRVLLLVGAFFQTRTGGECHPDDITHGVLEPWSWLLCLPCLYLPLLFPWVTEL